MNAASLRRRLGRDEGFTMITAMMALFIVGLLGAAAIAAAKGDLNLSRYDQDEKAAQAAAEAGINDYFGHLQQDPDYWTRCAGEDSSKPLGTGNAVNQQFTGAPPATRKWRDVPNGGTATAEYSIELIPAPGKSSCDVNDPAGSMVGADGNLRVRATGHIKGTKNYEAVVATFRRTGFLDFLYFTDLENQDPTYLQIGRFGKYQTRATDANGVATPADPDLATWAADKCERHYWGTQASGEGRREYPYWRGQFFYNGDWYDYPPNAGVTAQIGKAGYIPTSVVCGEITFATDDQVNGPFHSNDDIAVRGTPDFGRSGNKDAVEVANINDGNDQGWRGSATPNFRTASGKLAVGAETLNLPPGNGAIKRQAKTGYLFTGQTTIDLNGDGTMDVTNGGTTQTNVPVPPNGVIYVQNVNPTCIYGYDPDNTSTPNPSCGTVKVYGTYTKDLTIGAEDDVIVTANLQRASSTPNAVLGLVAKNFVRVWHPVASRSYDSNGDVSCTRDSSTPTNIKIDAAILSLKHSFTVDNYDCDTSLGTLSIKGVIAQLHRGIVGTQGGTGYIKNYTYDDKLKYRSPPYFLDPVQASWRILRLNDQSGAR